MTLDSDRLLKRVWLVNGLALLALLLISVGVAVVSFVSDWRGRDDAAVLASARPGETEASARIRAVRFDVPARIRGTDTRLVLVRNGAGFLPEDVAAIGSRSQYDASSAPQGGPIANVIFLPANGASGRLVFDRPAYIVAVSYPGAAYGADSMQTWITYDVALEDTNGNGRLDENDRRELFVSDLEGAGLRAVLPPALRLQGYESMGDARTLVVTALEAPARDQRDWDERTAVQHAFTYEVATRTLRPLSALDSLAVRAGRILGATASRSAR